MGKIFGIFGKEDAEESQLCPTCSTALVLRQFQSGPQMGVSFYGCPTCRQRWSLDELPKEGAVSQNGGNS